VTGGPRVGCALDRRWPAGAGSHGFAALTLVDHTRIVYRELYEASGQFTEYQAEVERRFVKGPLVQFVQKLRHMAQHVRLPDISYNLSFDQQRGTTRQLLLKKQDLLQTDVWNAPAKEYLRSAPDLIDLSELVTRYTDEIRAFYRWMAQRQREIHAGDIAAVESKQAEARSLMAPEIPRLLETGLTIWGQGVGALDNIFAFGFSPADWVRLSPLEGDMEAWTNAALELTEKKFGPLPAETVARIKEAARKGRRRT
jgi:hypothetical protein